MHTAMPAPPYGRRGCSDAASNGHRLPPDGAQHLLSSAALLRQTSRDVLSLGSREGENQGSGNYVCYFFFLLWTKKALLFFFFSPSSLRKDERRLRHPGVHLTRGRIRGKTSSFLRVFFGLSVHCAVEVLHPHKSPVELAFFFLLQRAA